MFSNLPGLRRSKSVAAMFLILALGHEASAIQNATTSTISGVVKDVTGALIPDAVVIILSTADEMTWTARTNESGRFVRSGLPAGTYDVVTVFAGFGQGVVRGIKLGAGETAVLAVAISFSYHPDVIVSLLAQTTGTTALCFIDRFPGTGVVDENCPFGRSFEVSSRPNGVLPNIESDPNYSRESPLISMAAFEYPRSARTSRFESTLLFWVDVGSDGRIRHIGAASDTSPNPILKEFSMEEIRKWKFKPVERLVTIQISYRIAR